MLRVVCCVLGCLWWVACLSVVHSTSSAACRTYAQADGPGFFDINVDQTPTATQTLEGLFGAWSNDKDAALRALIFVTGRDGKQRVMPTTVAAAALWCIICGPSVADATMDNT
jgi:hypothetical protein